jgi:hypothetical protein
MRVGVLTLSAVVLVAVGCGVPGVAPEGSVSSQIGPPPIHGPVVPAGCFLDHWLVLGPDTSVNPWTGLAPGYVAYTAWNGGYIVYGYDTTLTNVQWLRWAGDKATVTVYQNMAGTLPYHCAPTYNTEVGQIGSVDVPVPGGGNTPPGTANCPDPTNLHTLQMACACPNSDPCADVECGTASDGCGNTFECGGCASRWTCSFGTCVPLHVPNPTPCHGACI